MNTRTKCLAITAAFEGASFGTLADAGDGAGWSFGPIQWNPKSGTLQPLLLDFYQHGPLTFKRCCTVPVGAAASVKDLSPDLLAMARMAPADAVAWCNAREDRNRRPLNHWLQVFANLGREPGFQAIEAAHVGWYWRAAMNYMAQFGFKSERAAALLLDICVQEGSVTPASLARYNAAGATTERERITALAVAVGPQAGPWADDVESRKLTIARGTGTVHGRTYNLAGAPYFLTDGPVTE